MKEIRRVYANLGIQREYKRRLDKLIQEMYASVVYWLSMGYTPEQVAKQIRKLAKAWQKRFNKEAAIIAKWFVDSVRNGAVFGMQQAFIEQGYYIKPRIKREIEQAVLVENEELISSIPAKFFAGLLVVAMMSFQYEDSDLTTEIKKRYDMTERRAKMIAEDQNHKATQIFKMSICENLGITKGMWKYTWRSKEPRLSHVRADGRIFDLREGCRIDGKNIFPAEEYNCKCDFVPIVTEFNDDNL